MIQLSKEIRQSNTKTVLQEKNCQRRYFQQLEQILEY